MMQQMNSHSNPLPLGPRRHSNVVNGSGKLGTRKNFEKTTQPLLVEIFLGYSNITLNQFWRIEKVQKLPF